MVHPVRQEGGARLTSSTPDALWSAPSVRLLRPAAVSCVDLRLGRLPDRLTLTVPVGMRLLLVSNPPEAVSALLRVLAGLTRSGGGRIRIAGLDDPSIDGWGRRVAYVGRRTGIRPWMTPREVLVLATSLLGMAPDESERRIERALAWVRIERALAERAIRSGGPALAERTAFAAALVGDPEVLLLDEPLGGVAAAERTRLLQLPGRRRTVLLASREPEREAGLASHVGLMRGGRLVLLAPIEDLEAAALPLSRDGLETLSRSRPRGRAGPSSPVHAAPAR